MFPFISATKEIPETDLLFAITATSVDGYLTFRKVQNTIKYIIDQYGIDKVHYGAIVFGATARKQFGFSDKFLTPSDLKRRVDGLPRQFGGPALDKALEAAQEMFQGAGARPGARQVLVVITDKNSGLDERVVKAAAKPLELKAVRVIPVGLGGDIGLKELESITPQKDNVIKEPKNIDHAELGEKIMEEVIKGKTL